MTLNCVSAPVLSQFWKRNMPTIPDTRVVQQKDAQKSGNHNLCAKKWRSNASSRGFQMKANKNGNNAWFLSNVHIGAPLSYYDAWTCMTAGWNWLLKCFSGLSRHRICLFRWPSGAERNYKVGTFSRSRCGLVFFSWQRFSVFDRKNLLQAPFHSIWAHESSKIGFFHIHKYQSLVHFTATNAFF